MNKAYPAGEVDLHGKDTNVLGTGKVVLFECDDGYGRDGHGLQVKMGEEVDIEKEKKAEGRGLYSSSRMRIG